MEKRSRVDILFEVQTYTGLCRHEKTQIIPMFMNWTLKNSQKRAGLQKCRMCDRYDKWKWPLKSCRVVLDGHVTMFNLPNSLPSRVG